MTRLLPVPLALLSVVAVACSPTSSDPDAEHPCKAENHCVRQDGEVFCEDGYTWQDPADADNYNCVSDDDPNLNEGVDCRETPCAGLFYCDLASGECLSGCATTSQCAALEICETASHSCECAEDAHACGDSCVSDDDVATCGDRCSPCPSDANGSAVCRSEQCAFECDDGYRECASGCCPVDCQSGEKRCSDDRVQTCSNDGTWVDGTLCDTSCSAGACTECAPGAASCDWWSSDEGGEPLDYRQVCSSNGSWEQVEACPAGCVEPDDFIDELQCRQCSPGNISCGDVGTEVCNSEGQPEARSSVTNEEFHTWDSEKRVCGDIEVAVDISGAGFWSFPYQALSTGTVHVVNSAEAGGGCARVLTIKRNGDVVYTSDPNAFVCPLYDGTVAAGDLITVSFSNPGTSCSSDCRDIFTSHVWVD